MSEPIVDPEFTPPTEGDKPNTLAAALSEFDLNAPAFDDAPKANSDVTPDVPEEPEAPKQKPVLIEIPQFFESAVNSELGDIHMALPDSDAETIRKRLEASPNLRPTDTVWGTAIYGGMDVTYRENQFSKRLYEANTGWRQYIRTPKNTILRGGPSRMKQDSTNGESQILGLLHHISAGTTHQEFLWNSGISIRIKPCHDVEFIDFQFQHLSDEIKLGRETYGLAFSTMNTTFVRQILDFIMEHRLGTTVKDSGNNDTAELYKLIRVTDIPAIILCFANAVFPNGFDYSRACTANTESCNHVTRGRVSMRDWQLVASEELTDWQMTHMASTALNSRTPEQIRQYQEELRCLQNRTIEIYPDDEKRKVTIELTVPFISDYLDEGAQWLSSIVQTVRGAVTKNMTADVKNRYMAVRANAAMLVAHQPWVKSIQYGDTAIITDRNLIREALSGLTGDDYFRNTLLEHIHAFKDSCTVSIVGIEAYNCPKCGKPQEKEAGKNAYFADYVPIDMISTFFGLISQKAERVEKRLASM